MSQTQLILVGGFLGAGKTTLLGQAARHLLARGKRVGLITNDQAADLVDTGYLRQAGLDVAEIAGGCFCCRFGQLIETADALVAEMAPDIIIGEPVGSCTDLSATVVQPIKDLYADRYALAPLSVLVDPDRLWEVLEPRRRSPMHASARYILRKQLEEADIILLNKADRLDDAERDELLAAAAAAFPGTPIRLLSALTGDGVAAWLDEMLAGAPVGRRIVEVDYDIYAEGEAVLGWLNTSVELTAAGPVDWRAVAVAVLDGIQQAAVARGTEIAHAKVSVTAPAGQVVANLTSTGGAIAARGALDSASSAALVVNARVEMTPEELQGIVESILRTVAGDTLTATITAMHSLSPGRPTPTHRYGVVVE
jgi:G3E family GTPase